MKITECFTYPLISSKKLENVTFLGKIKFTNQPKLKVKCLVFYSLEYSQYVFRVITELWKGKPPLHDYLILLTPNKELSSTYRRPHTDILTLVTISAVEELHFLFFSHLPKVIGELILDYLLY